MILQSLVSLYETLVEQGKVDRPGWSKIEVSYGLELDEQGTLVRIVSLKQPLKDGKCMKPKKSLPIHDVRTSGIKANFLCDKSEYFFGKKAKGNDKRSKECFAACRELHLSVLSDVHTEGGEAIKAFFEKWIPDNTENELSRIGTSDGVIKDILKNDVNLVFMPLGAFASEDSEICSEWQKYSGNSYTSDTSNAVYHRCLVTGEVAPVETVHPQIKGVRGTDRTYAPLISFNFPSSESYEKSKGMNAHVSKYAAFAYTTALNYLLEKNKQINFFGDTTVVCWAEDNEDIYGDFFNFAINGTSDSVSEAEVWDVIGKLAQGKPVNWGNIPINPDNNFYILGLSPSTQRISVRFFLQNKFGKFMENSLRHEENMKITAPLKDKREHVSLGAVLSETVNQKSKSRSAKPQLAGDVIYSVLTGTKYPETLFDNVMIRINADREINRNRAAIIKAYLLKNHENISREALQVELNEKCDVQAYILGELFALLEEIQQKASGDNLNSTIKDSYFTAASSTPAMIFPTLLDLAQNHLKKIGGTDKDRYHNELKSLLSRINEELPARMTLQEKGVFQIGYYHKTQYRFKPKEDK